MAKPHKIFLKKLKNLGCTITVRKNTHLKIQLPNGNVVFCSNTPSDPRAQKNIIRDLRREGLQGL